MYVQTHTCTGNDPVMINCPWVIIYPDMIKCQWAITPELITVIDIIQYQFDLLPDAQHQGTV